MSRGVWVRDPDRGGTPIPVETVFCDPREKKQAAFLTTDYPWKVDQ